MDPLQEARSLALRYAESEFRLARARDTGQSVIDTQRENLEKHLRKLDNNDLARELLEEARRFVQMEYEREAALERMILGRLKELMAVTLAGEIPEVGQLFEEPCWNSVRQFQAALKQGKIPETLDALDGLLYLALGEIRDTELPPVASWDPPPKS